MSDRIEKTIELKAPVERVWRALTDHEEFGSWFRVKIDRPFRVGEKATGQMSLSECGQLTWMATIQTSEAPRFFAFTWHPYAVDPGTDYSTETPTLVEFTLEPVPGGTRLVVVESGFDALPVHRRDEAFRMNDRGWGKQLENIRAHVDA